MTRKSSIDCGPDLPTIVACVRYMSCSKALQCTANFLHGVFDIITQNTYADVHDTALRDFNYSAERIADHASSAESDPD